MKTNNKKGVLEKIGLSSDDNLVYMTLLQRGGLSASDIVRKTKLHRPAVYRVLATLEEAGLVAQFPKGKSKVYVAESPERVERLFESLEDDFNADIYELNDLYQHQEKKPIVTFQEGDKAIVDMFSDMVHELDKNDTYYRYSPALSLERRKYVPKDYRLIRDKKGLERLIITDKDSLPKTSAKLGRSVKAVPDSFKLFTHNVSQTIYGDKVSFVDYNTKSVITIENPMIAEFQKKIFRLLFSKL